MKKAIRISGIIWAVFMVLFAVIFLIAALTSNGIKEDMIAEIMKNPDVTREVAEQAFNIAIYMAYGAAVYLFVGAAYSIVLVSSAGSSVGKGLGIFLGVLGIVLGAELPGILFIVDSAKNRQ